MDKISQEETDFLFEWVKNWYPTTKKPKIVILLLNEREWRNLYQNMRRIGKEERDKRIAAYVKDKPELKELVEMFGRLTDDQKRLFWAQETPHGVIRGMDNLDYWMNEVSGECFCIEELKGIAEILQTEVDEFFTPYLDTDFVIIVSNFFNKKQKKIVKTQAKREFYVHSIIFHELIHIIEKCNDKLIFKTNDVIENDKIIFTITRAYFS